MIKEVGRLDVAFSKMDKLSLAQVTMFSVKYDMAIITGKHRLHDHILIYR